MPVSIGDEVKTKGGSAVVQFPDGSGVTLQPNSTLRIEGQPNNISVRVISGSAIYDLARTTTIRMANSKGQPVSSPLTRSFVPPANAQQSQDPLATAVVYRNTLQKNSGMVVPNAAVLTGSFISFAPAAGTNPGGPEVVLPNGDIINLTANTPTTPGGAVTYTVVSVTVPVTTTTNNITTVTTLTITASTAGANSLIGDTFTLQPSTTSGTSSSAITVTTSNGTAVPNPGSALTSTVTSGVNTAITNGVLPTGTTAPSPDPVSTGAFSPSAN
jgi:hypothetical protein